jgi:uncharacterized protein
MMEITEFTYRVRPELADLGDSAELEGVLTLGQISKGALIFELEKGISYTLNLSNTGRGVLLTGTARITGTTECARCLDPAHVEVEGEVVGYYILNPDEEDEEFSDDESIAVDSSGIIDLATPVIAAIIHELPQVPLCKEDCAGLCPQCGVNLNEQSCSCADQPSSDNPFSVLTQLKQDKEPYATL